MGGYKTSFRRKPFLKWYKTVRTRNIGIVNENTKNIVEIIDKGQDMRGHILKYEIFNIRHDIKEHKTSFNNFFILIAVTV